MGVGGVACFWAYRQLGRIQLGAAKV
jgi:hypothetical protein